MCIPHFGPHRMHSIRKRRTATDRVARTICRFVCLSVTAVNPAKSDEPIKMPFGTGLVRGRSPNARGHSMGDMCRAEPLPIKNWGIHEDTYAK